MSGVYHDGIYLINDQGGDSEEGKFSQSYNAVCVCMRGQRQKVICPCFAVNNGILLISDSAHPLLASSLFSNLIFHCVFFFFFSFAGK